MSKTKKMNFFGGERISCVCLSCSTSSFSSWKNGKIFCVNEESDDVDVCDEKTRGDVSSCVSWMTLTTGQGSGSGRSDGVCS